MKTNTEEKQKIFLLNTDLILFTLELVSIVQTEF